MRERQSVTAVVAVRYMRAGKKDKGQIVDEFTQHERACCQFEVCLERPFLPRINI